MCSGWGKKRKWRQTKVITKHWKIYVVEDVHTSTERSHEEVVTVGEPKQPLVLYS
jgi:hypothetical protein